MTHYKLHLDEDDTESFNLIAIHCSEEPYKLAFLLNKHLSMQLQRKKADLEFVKDQTTALFAIYEFENVQQYTQFYMVQNKCKLNVENLQLAGSLFGESVEKTTMSYLLPEFKKVDFFLKIESDMEQFPVRKTLAQINEIKEVISAYIVDYETIKSQNNLIFN